MSLKSHEATIICNFTEFQVKLCF